MMMTALRDLHRQTRAQRVTDRRNLKQLHASFAFVLHDLTIDHSQRMLRCKDVRTVISRVVIARRAMRLLPRMQRALAESCSA
ncbi:hypothetical protein A7D16_07330 [Xanthomonas nasturtii]|nr:hypothetical protein A7D16_07330 [Xanthomonas nasturtii]